MIRKLKSGEYRLYSRKKDPRTGKRRNLGTFSTRGAAEQHEQKFSFSKKADRPVDSQRVLKSAVSL
jgi:hypothetical protein